MMIDMDRVPWKSRGEIERVARHILAKSSQRLGIEMRPPIPVEAIIEQVFEIHLLVEDLVERYSDLDLGDDLLGATLIPQRQILIHRDLQEDPENEGRYFFTCAHELAHWVLHRPLMEGCDRAKSEPKSLNSHILCRTTQSRKRGERQADQLAAFLLMPENEVHIAYRRAVSERSTILVNRESSVCRRGKPLWLEPVLSHVPYYAGEVIEAGNFHNVSRQAMSIRLLELGLLVNAVNNPCASTF